MQTMTELPAKLIPVLRAFGRFPKGEWETLGGGHINETLHLRLHSECCVMEDKVLQRLNTHVFPDPVGVMENITLVTAHLRSKGAATLIYDAAQDGRNFCRDQDGGFWRLCDYVPSVSYTSGAGPSVVEGAGEAFGAFSSICQISRRRSCMTPFRTFMIRQPDLPIFGRRLRRTLPGPWRYSPS